MYFKHLSHFKDKRRYWENTVIECPKKGCEQSRGDLNKLTPLFEQINT